MRVKAALRANLETQPAVEAQHGLIERPHHQVIFCQAVFFEVSQAVGNQSISDAMTAPFGQHKDVLRKTSPNAAAQVIFFVPIDAGETCQCFTGKCSNQVEPVLGGIIVFSVMILLEKVG